MLRANTFCTASRASSSIPIFNSASTKSTTNAMSSRNALLSPEARGRAPRFAELLGRTEEPEVVRRRLEDAGFEVDYVGVITADGTEFDNSYDTGQPLDFTLGAVSLIPGFEQGLVGLRQGRAPLETHYQRRWV